MALTFAPLLTSNFNRLPATSQCTQVPQLTKAPASTVMNFGRQAHLLIGASKETNAFVTHVARMLLL